MAGKKTVRKRVAQTKRSPRKKSAHSKEHLEGCPIVGIGGSAGGFEAMVELLRNLPAKNGMAYVLVQHLDPHHASRLPSLLSRVTQMPVLELSGRVRPAPDTVYVQPPNKCVICKDGVLGLIKRTERMNLAIDHFFESLAEAQGPRAIGIVLSGSGSDGTAGLRAIKAAGGITFAQDEETAKYPSMPRNAVLSGFVDAALSPKELAEELQKISDHPYIQQPDGEEEPEIVDKEHGLDDLHRIFHTLKKHTGVDFSSYKHSTLSRRIQ